MLSICATKLDQFGSVVTFSSLIKQFILYHINIIFWPNATRLLFLKTLMVPNSLVNFFQVQEDEIWNRFDHLEQMENALYNYTKQKASELMAKLLEMRTNSHGYIIFSCFLLSKLIVA